MAISNYDLFKIACRTSFVRLFYNYKCLFGQGICFCLQPVIKKQSKVQSDQCRIEIMQKNSSFFNCNEYLAGLAAGIILKQEELDSTKTAKLKQVLTSTLGAIGDRFFYQLVFPIILLLTANLVFWFNLIPHPFLFGSVLSIIVCFNLLIFFVRFIGVFIGYRLGTTALKFFKQQFYTKLDLILSKSVLFFRGVTIGNLIFFMLNLS